MFTPQSDEIENDSEQQLNEFRRTQIRILIDWIENMSDISAYHDDRQRHGQAGNAAEKRGGADEGERARVHPGPVGAGVVDVHSEQIHHRLAHNSAVQAANKPENM